MHLTTLNGKCNTSLGRIGTNHLWLHTPLADRGTKGQPITSREGQLTLTQAPAHSFTWHLNTANTSAHKEEGQDIALQWLPNLALLAAINIISCHTAQPNPKTSLVLQGATSRQGLLLFACAGLSPALAPVMMTQGSLIGYSLVAGEDT